MAQDETQYYAFVHMVAKICFIKGKSKMIIPLICDNSVTTQN